MFAFYLHAALTCAEKISILAAIELPNRAGGWTAAARIASDAHGVVPTALLHGEFAAFFRNEPTVVDLASDSALPPRCSVHSNSAAQLRKYFDPWRHHVPMTPVGAFLALLGPDPAIAEFASQCLQEGQRDLATTLSLISELRDCAATAGQFTEIRARHRFTITLAQGTTVTLQLPRSGA